MSEHDPKLVNTTDLLNALDFRDTDIYVIGDLMLDQYWMGDTQRISPEAPVPVVKVTGTETRLGGAANAALNAKSLGANVSLAGIIGEDDNGNQLTSLLKENGIGDSCIQSANARTINKLRMISRNQQVVRADFEEAFLQQDIDALTDSACKEVAKHKVVLLSDYAKGSLEQSQKIIRAANEANCRVIIDPKGNDFTKYQGAYLLTPNLSEFETIVGKCLNEQDMFKKASEMIKDLQLHALLLTRSEHGMTLFLADGSHHHFNAIAKEVYDVTGAGDTVIATLATAIAKGISLDNAVMLANTAASIAVSRMGAATVTPLELKLALENAGNRPTGITEEQQLKSLVEFEQSLGKKVVFTNGCFDILHKGHAQYLLEAGALGDRLIVAINSDNSVKRLKGEERPNQYC